MKLRSQNSHRTADSPQLHQTASNVNYARFVSGENSVAFNCESKMAGVYGLGGRKLTQTKEY